MSTDLVVAITLGPGDVQVLASDGKAVCRVSAHRRDVGPLHRMLLSDASPCDVWVPEDPAKELPEAEHFSLRVREAQLDLHWDDEPNGSPLRFATWEDLGDGVGKAPGRRILIPGRLWRRLRELASDVRSGAYSLKRVLLFHTSKASVAGSPKVEAIASASVVRAAIASLLGGEKGLPEGLVRDVACLHEDEVMREWYAPGATRVRFNVANRADQALAEASRTFPDAVLRLHHGTGLPELSSVVQAAARFRFRTVEFRPAVEVGKLRNPPPEAPWFTPADAIEARRRARDLVLHGELLAAEAVAQPFRRPAQGDSSSCAWAQAIEAVARYCRGYVEKARFLCQKLPSCRTRPALAAILDPRQPPSLHTAMWAELALLSEDVAEAVGLSVTFFDVALIDAAEKALRKEVDRDTREVQRSALGKDEYSVRFFLREWRDRAPDRRILPSKGEEEAWISHKSLRIVAPWQESVILHAIRVAPARAKLADALEELCRALHEPTPARMEPARLRNLREHAWLTDQHLDQATGVFSQRKLWHVADGVRSFLGTMDRPTLPCRVLHKMEVQQPRKLFDKLIQALVGDIEGLPPPAPPQNP